MSEKPSASANRLVQALARLDQRVVFAESCTGGLIAAELAKIPGVSDWLCGSAVTYRCDTKVQWLRVSADSIEQHTAVSAEVAQQMTSGVLANTPEASWSAAITGHLGPGAPEGFDGVVYVGVACRQPDHEAPVQVTRHLLSSTDRLSRQAEAAELVMQQLLRKLDG